MFKVGSLGNDTLEHPVSHKAVHISPTIAQALQLIFQCFDTRPGLLAQVVFISLRPKLPIRGDSTKQR
jgi:hypothetical protein